MRVVLAEKAPEQKQLNSAETHLKSPIQRSLLVPDGIKLLIQNKRRGNQNSGVCSGLILDQSCDVRSKPQHVHVSSVLYLPWCE